MGPGWQALDVVVRFLKIGLRSTDFQQQPAIVAVLQSMLNTADKLVSARITGDPGTPSAPSPKSGADRADGASPSADADAQPSAESSMGDET